MQPFSYFQPTISHVTNLWHHENSRSAFDLKATRVTRVTSVVNEMWNCRHVDVARVYSPFQQIKNSWCRCLNFLLIYRRRNGCNYLKHNYHYGMTRADFINRFKNRYHINIEGNNHVALCRCRSRIVYQLPYCKQHVYHEMVYFYLQWECAKFTLALIEFVKSNSLLKSQMRDTFHKTAYD